MAERGAKVKKKREGRKKDNIPASGWNDGRRPTTVADQRV